MCLVFALVIGVPGLVLATPRYFVELDRILQQVIVIGQFGPVKFARPRKLTDIQIPEASPTTPIPTRRATSRRCSMDVASVRRRGCEPIELASFDKREAATGSARDIGTALGSRPRTMSAPSPTRTCKGRVKI